MIGATAIFTPGAAVRDRVLAALARGVTRGAELVAEEARLTVTVDTGDVQSKIEARPSTIEGESATAVVVSGSDHGGYLEYGTGQRGEGSAGAGPGPYDPNWPGMVAQPYLRPAIDTRRTEVIEAIHAEVKGAL